MSRIEYLLAVWTDTRIRHAHRTARGRIIEFSLQLEIDIEGAWRPVIRYDTAHRSAHIDRFSLRGKPRKEWLGDGLAEALTRAERDLKQNWQVYRERFLRGEYP